MAALVAAAVCQLGMQNPVEAELAMQAEQEAELRAQAAQANAVQVSRCILSQHCRFAQLPVEHNHPTQKPLLHTSCVTLPMLLPAVAPQPA